VSLRVSELGEFREFNELGELKTQETHKTQGTHKTLRFEIEDTGPGIAPDDLDSLFEAFVQTEVGRQAQEGTGLGLPISRRFVQLMGGDMQVESEIGRGTTFEFDIRVELADPIENPHSPGRTAPGKSKNQNRVIALKPNQPRYRILIVDDKWANRQLLIKLLSNVSSPRSGFELREAETGREAIEIWDVWEPHLIWMDMRMPVTDGYEATRQIKATTKGQATAVIAVTTSALEEEETMAIAAGCDDFLRKPFREADIFDTMQKHIGVRYMYEEQGSRDAKYGVGSKEESPRPNLQSLISNFPSELLTDLEEAAKLCDMKMVDSAITEIRGHNATLANALAKLADDFQYDKLLALIEGASDK